MLLYYQRNLILDMTAVYILVCHTFHLPLSFTIGQ